jgi:hypothetical protein
VGINEGASGGADVDSGFGDGAYFAAVGETDAMRRIRGSCDEVFGV